MLEAMLCVGVMITIWWHKNQVKPEHKIGNNTNNVFDCTVSSHSYVISINQLFNSMGHHEMAMMWWTKLTTLNGFYWMSVPFLTDCSLSLSRNILFLHDKNVPQGANGRNGVSWANIMWVKYLLFGFQQSIKLNSSTKRAWESICQLSPVTVIMSCAKIQSGHAFLLQYSAQIV